jgi:hypothetical protein
MSPRWKDDEGVAATVGTIMALLVFLTFMGIFTNQFVPVWMSDNESTHMAEAIGQMTTLKSQVDIVVSNYPNSLVAPSPIAVPITLSAPGIPIFAAPTAGILQFYPYTVGARPSFSIDYSWVSQGTTYNLGDTTDSRTGGSLELYCPNRYYVEQTLIYESGAVILNQTDGEYIIAKMQFSVENRGTPSDPSRVVKITQVTLQGRNNTIGGTGSKMVNADLKYGATVAYENNAGSAVTITIVSEHGIAWETYFNSTLKASNLIYGTDFEISKSYHIMPNRLDNYYTITVVVQDVKVLDHTHATIDMSIGELGVL